MSQPLTVGELIEELSRYPSNTLPEMVIQTEVKTTIGNCKEKSELFFVHGKIYGVGSITVNKKQIVEITGG